MDYSRIDRVNEEKVFVCVVDTSEPITSEKIKEMKADLLLHLENTGITDEWYEED